MAEGRFISRTIAFSEQLGQVSLEADYLFMRMLPHLDCEGRLAGSARSIRAHVCPLRDDLTIEGVSAALAELDQARLVNWYEVDGIQCVEYPNFSKHQVGLRKNREAASRVPASSVLGAARVRTNQPILHQVPECAGVGPEDSGVGPQNCGVDRDNSKLSKGKLSEVKYSSSSSTPEDSGVGPEWPKSWAYDSSQAFLSHGSVVSTAICGSAAKTLRDVIPWDEWLRVIERLTHSTELGYGLQTALRSLKQFRDDAQPDPNRDLTPEEAFAA